MWMLTGGAGYIGAHIARALLESGREVVVLDDLSTGSRERVPRDARFVEADVTDPRAVAAALRDHTVSGVVHLAGKKAPAESVARPVWYYRQNVDGMLAVLEAMADVGVERLVFSSTCAVYGTPAGDGVVTEGSPTRPESPYGESKLVSEWALRDVAAVSDVQFISLRYFNVAGAAAPEIADTGEYNLIPLALRALREKRNPQVFGADYPTRDGSCIRDYIHVSDLADAHVAAAARLEGSTCREVYNVGRGEGVTVLEVLDALREVSGVDFAHDVVARRPGDPAQVVACADKVRAELGWAARHDLHAMVESAWEARAS